MNDQIFKIGADGIDSAKIVEEIRKTVEDKMEKGVYTDAKVAFAERTNLAHLQDDEQFFDFYLNCLREAVFVDISDFEIYERRKVFGKILIAFKRFCWKILKFYTYRLWSQQNRANGLLLGAIEGIENRYRDRIANLEKRISELEQKK